MKKCFRNSLYITTGVVVCLAIGSALFFNGIGAEATDSINVDKEPKVLEKEKNNYLERNENVKPYDDISSVVENAGFDFKLPDYIIEGNEPYAYHIRKLSDSSNALQVAFNSKSRKNKFSLFAFKGDTIESLKTINETRHNTNNVETITSDEEIKDINSVKGKNITLTIISSNQKEVVKYFVWEEDNVSYAIEYSTELSIDKTSISNGISEEDMGLIAKSLKNLDDIKNVDYTEIENNKYK